MALKITILVGTMTGTAQLCAQEMELVLDDGETEVQTRLMDDLGFDSLQVLELVGELEDHFNIAVPLNSLTLIRTVAEIAGEVRRLVTEPEART